MHHTSWVVLKASDTISGNIHDSSVETAVYFTEERSTFINLLILPMAVCHAYFEIC